MAVAALVAVILLVLVLVARVSIIALTPETLVAAPSPASRDELISIGGHVLLLKHGSTGNRIAHWLHAESKSSRAFEVGDGAFVPDSAVLTSEGERRSDVFAEMIKQVHAVNAEIIVSANQGNVHLSQQREHRFRQKLVDDGVAASRLTISTEPVRGGAALTKGSELIVVLST